MLFLFGHAANGQENVLTKWGEEIKHSKKEGYLEIVGAEGEFFYTTKDLYGSSDVFLLEK